MPVLYTIGHSNHPFSRFLELLLRHGIGLVVDVRRQPYSRHNPQYNRERLAGELRSAGIDYRYLGDKVGGRLPLSAEQIYQRAEFKQGIQELSKLADQGVQTTLLCAEEDPRHCHRHHLLEPALTACGIRLKHIRGNGLLEELPLKAAKQLNLFK